jgi:hypothetical protein
LLLKAHDTSGYIIRRKSIQPLEQAIASRLLFPLQDGQVVRIEEHRHKHLPFDLSLANQATKAADLGKGFIASKDANDFTVPGLGWFPANGGLQFRKFPFDPLKSGFQLSCSMSHDLVIVPSRPQRRNSLIEHRIGVPLPAAYRRFLDLCGGWWGEIVCRCQEPTPFGIEHGIHAFHKATEVAALLDSMIAPRNMVTNGTGHFAKYTCLSVAGIDHGSVYALDGELRGIPGSVYQRGPMKRVMMC